MAPPNASAASRSGRTRLWVLGIVAVALLTQWPALQGELLWDDRAHVTRQDLRGWDGLWRIWFEPGATQQYYPVLHTAFWIERRLWGDAVLGYHLVNVLLHAGNACLLALLLTRLWPRRAEVVALPPRGVMIPPAPWLVALLFVAHPVGVESVAWITEQKNTLSTAFYLLAAWVFLLFHEGRRTSDYGVASGLYLLALGTKTTTATLPAALLVILWWKQGRIDWRRDALPLLPWFAVAIPAGLITAQVERTMIGADVVVPDLSIIERTLLAARVLWFYAGKLVWPDVTFFYPLWNVAEQSHGWIGFLLATLLATLGAWMLRRRSRAPLALWLLYGGTLFPALGFFKVYPFQFSYVADHFQYLAMPVAVTAAAAAVQFALEQAPGLRRVAPWLIGTVVLVLAVLSFRQSRLYRNDEILFRANIAENPSSWMGYRILASRVGKDPARRAEAIALFRQALELNPRSAETHGAFGGLLVMEPGHSEEAIALFEEAIRLRPGYAEAHNALANEIVAIPGRLHEAIDHYQTALRLRPDFAMAEANLAMALSQLPERQEDALRHFDRSLRVLPNYAPARFRLAQLLATVPGRSAEAVDHYLKAIEVRPEIPEARFEVAALLIGLGRLTEAARQLDEALRLAPAYVDALNLRGVIFAQQGRVEEARLFWTRALTIAPGFEPARRNLRDLEAKVPR